MKGIILEKGFKYYTDMKAVLAPIRDDFKKYNWLITDCECNHYPDPKIQFNAEYSWISGGDFLSLVNEHDIQFIWAVFSAIPKHILLDEVLKYEIPYADGYTGFWKNPISIQHPLADIEIVPWDSSLVLVISKDDDVATRVKTHFPLSEDLECYNAQEGT